MHDYLESCLVIGFVPCFWCGNLNLPPMVIMISEKIDKERAIRFYRWAVEDGEREVRQGYPIVKRIMNHDSLNYLSLAEAMPIEEQIRLSRLLVSKHHPAARALLGETFDVAENIILEEYSFAARLRSSLSRQTLSMLTADNQRHLSEQFLMTTVHSLAATLGPSRQDGSEVVYITPVFEWFVGTRLKFLSNKNAIRYWQNVMASADEYPGAIESPSQNGTNILNWLGLGRTQIQVGSEPNYKRTIEILIDVCSHYLNGMHTVLAGLTPEVMEEWDGVHWWQRLLL